MFRSAQFYHHANADRGTAEQLKRSFPEPSAAPEAVERVNALIDDYNQQIRVAEDEYRKCESEMVSRLFRFPDRVAGLLRARQVFLSGFLDLG
jgi:hypothetical protein